MLLALSENAPNIRVCKPPRAPADMDSQGPKTTIPTLQPPPPPRRILGDVSPNLRTTMAGSADSVATDSFSLKRSVSATLDNGPGFTYLKKRKLSNDGTLSGARKPSLEMNPVQKTTTTTTTTTHATLIAPSREQVRDTCSSVCDRGLTFPRPVNLSSRRACVLQPGLATMMRAARHQQNANPFLH